ncbi:LarC family nickel insertion protein [Consotaella aegiceratis]|uniref:LarC family nickel insertion protein n=1 Tax=Consotaella aegiceratis TaxID=3097961 RepID=UPI002F4270AA
MLDAFPGLVAQVMTDVSAVLPEAAGVARLEPGTSGSMAVLRFRLDTGESVPHSHGEADGDEGGHRHDHSHAGHHHEHHHHEHDADHRHGDGGDGPHHGPSSRFPDLCARIRQVNLHAGTAERAIAILTRLAEAESRMHGVPLSEVHFHEIADWDSLMDVVAAGSIAAALDGARWSVSDLPRGNGLVRTQHGLLPVPAPATAAILEGFSWRDDGIGGERVTPTGAAIVAHLVDPLASRAGAGGRMAASGMGAGTRTLPGMPNILRVLAFAAEAAPADEEVFVLSFDIDDMTGEEIGVATERLRDLPGVIDLTIGQRAGKKSRPVVDFRLLVAADALSAVKDACFAETSTLGLRWRREVRACLRRRADAVDVEGAAIRRKHVARPFGGETVKAESDDLAKGEGLAHRRRLKALAERDEDPA